LKISVLITGVKEAKDAFSKDLTSVYNGIMEGFVGDVLSLIRGNVPVSTGKLLDSIESSMIGISTWDINESSNYGRFVRYGTMPHYIYPVNKKALYWEGIKGGRPVARALNPGITPDDYVEKSRPEFDAAAQRTIEQLIGVTVQERSF